MTDINLSRDFKEADSRRSFTLELEDEHGIEHQIPLASCSGSSGGHPGKKEPVRILGKEVDPACVLGEGGQGIVCRTQDPFIAVKLARTNHQDITDRDQITAFQDKVHDLLLLRLPGDLRISLPFAVLRDHAGYVMRLLNTAESFEKGLLSTSYNVRAYGGIGLTRAVSVFAPDQSKQFQDLPPEERVRFTRSDTAPVMLRLVRYIATGGTRLRFCALGHAAGILSRIHALGMVYGDISANNVFLAGDDDEGCSVWLIDSDNLNYEKQKGPIVMTPKYGAPELVQRQAGISSVSDCHAFAVLAERCLAWVHPFHGRLLEEGDWSDGTDGMTLEDKANAGMFPWIDDPWDDSNREEKAEGMLPRHTILTEGVLRLMELTFCRGRTYPGARPGAALWARELFRARDLTLKCTRCGMTLPIRDAADAKCPCCDVSPSSPAVLELKAYALLPGGRCPEPEWIWHHEIENPDEHWLFRIPTRVFRSFDMRDHDQPFLQAEYRSGGTGAGQGAGSTGPHEDKAGGFVFLRKLSTDDSRIWVLAPGGRSPKEARPASLEGDRVAAPRELDGSFWLIAESPLGQRRAVSLQLIRRNP